jgi:1-acyl-sn-glycerol-3-phosphate acyltransferase
VKLLIKRFFIALCFVSFGAFCMVGNLFFVPIFVLRLNRFSSVRNFARDLIYFSWKGFIWLIFVYGSVGAKFRVSGNLPRQGDHIIVANHPSLLDVVLFLSHFRRANCVVKASLLKNIFLFGAIRAAGYIPNTANEEMIERCVAALRGGENLIIFPEGTRTKERIEMHKGAFYIAVRAAESLKILCVKMSPKSLKKGDPWYDTPKVMMKYEIYERDAVDLGAFEPARPNPVRVRLLHKKVQEIYDKEDL